jgi:hypothetical protein
MLKKVQEKIFDASVLLYVKALTMVKRLGSTWAVALAMSIVLSIGAAGLILMAVS